MIVMKFGGSSIDSSQAIRNVAGIVRKKRNRQPIVVLSACNDTTDNLELAVNVAVTGETDKALAELDKIYEYHRQMAGELQLENHWEKIFNDKSRKYYEELKILLTGASMLRDIAKKSMDRVLAFGERFSTLLFSCYLNSTGTPAQLLDSTEFIKTTEQHTSAQPILEESNPHIERTFNNSVGDGKIPVVQGFIGSTLDGAVTTLGRGGSDFTASIIGAALQVEDIEIWSDVDGVLTADPTIIEHAKVVDRMSFREASELAYFGARVLHPDSILPAVERDIPIHIYNSRNVDSSGSLIRAEFPDNNHTVVKSIAYKEAINVLNLTSTRMFQAHDFLRKVFEVLDRHEMVADLVSTSEVSISIAFHRQTGYHAVMDELSKFASVSLESSKAIVCLVGEKMRARKGLLGTIFQTLDQINVNMVAQGASEVNLSFVIDEKDIERTVKKLHQVFFTG